MVDTSGRAVASARVRIDAGKTVVTDARGHANAALTDGTHRYGVSAFGYTSASGSLDVHAGQNAVTVRMKPSAAGLQVIGSVTGHGRAAFNATPVSERVYPREAYRDQGQPAVSSVMNQTSGALAIVPNANAPGTPLAPQFPSIRNSLPFETPISIDGDPVSLPSTGSFDLTLLPTFVLQEVEIVKGPGDVSGAGTGTGGAINFRTADPTLVRRGTFETEADSRGGSFTDLAYDGTQPGGKFAYATMLSVDGSPCCGPLPADASRRAVLVKLHLQPGSHVSVGGTFLNVALSRNVSSYAGFETPAGTFVANAPSLTDVQSSALTFADANASIDAGNNAFDMHVFASSVRSSTEAPAYVSQAIDQDAGGSLRWQHTSKALSYGILLRDDAGNASSNDLYTQPLPSGSKATTTLARIFATLKDAANQFDIAAESAHRHFDAQNLRLAYARTLAPNVNVRLAYGSTGVLPSLDMLSSYPPYLLRFAGLPPVAFAYTSNIDSIERAAGGDAGIEWRLHGDTTTFSADMYRTATQGTYMAQNAMQWINGPGLVESGVEFTLQQFKPVGMGFIVAASFPRTYVWSNIPAGFYAFGANAAVVAGLNLSGGLPPALGNYNDVAPVRFPYAQGYGEISYKWPRGSRASLGAQYVGANNGYGRDAFVTFNSNLELSLGSRGKLQISAENVFNAIAGTVPLLGGGTPIQLANGSTVPSPLAGLTPFTLRVMVRESFGEGSLYEH